MYRVHIQRAKFVLFSFFLSFILCVCACVFLGSCADVFDLYSSNFPLGGEKRPFIRIRVLLDKFVYKKQKR